MLAWLLVLLGFLGIADNLHAGAAVFYAREFGLSDSAMASTMAWMALGAVFAAALSRQMDRTGRRRILLVSTAGFSLSAAVVALAPSLTSLVVAAIAVGAFAGTLLSATNVTIAEELPTSERARGLARAALVFQVGGGLGFLIIAFLEHVPGTWRWAWAIVATPAVLVPLLSRTFSETRRFERARAGSLERGRLRELLEHTYRSRTLSVAACAVLINSNVATAHVWILYYPEAVLGLSVRATTVLVIAGGAIGLLGYPLGAAMADRLGRRATVLIFGSCFTASMVGYYQVDGAPQVSTAFALGALFAVGSVCFGAELVAARTAVTELFPTRLRGTVQGLTRLAQAASFMIGQFVVSALTTLFGLSHALAIVLIFGGTGFVLFYLLLPETMGMELEEASIEAKTISPNDLQ